MHVKESPEKLSSCTARLRLNLAPDTRPGARHMPACVQQYPPIIGRGGALLDRGGQAKSRTRPGVSDVCTMHCSGEGSGRWASAKKLCGDALGKPALVDDPWLSPSSRRTGLFFFSLMSEMLRSAWRSASGPALGGPRCSGSAQYPLHLLFVARLSG